MKRRRTRRQIRVRRWIGGICVGGVVAFGFWCFITAALMSGGYL